MAMGHPTDITTATTTTIIKNTNINEGNGEDGLFETGVSSDYDHPYHETACEWYHHHVLRRARRLAGVTSSSDSSSCSSRSSSGSYSYNNEGLEEEYANGTKLLSLGNYHDGEFYSDGGADNNDESIRSAKRPLTRWMATYPLVAARCCLSIDPSSTSTTARGTSPTISNSIQGTYNTNPRLYEVARLRRVFQRLHRRHNIWQKKMNYGNSGSPLFRHPTYSPSIMSLDQQLLRIKQETIDTERNRMVIQSFLPQGTGIPFIDAVLGGESLLVTTTPSKPALLERTKKEHPTRYKSTSRLVLELVRMERFSQYIALPLLLLILTESSSFLV
jgi:hypothetical protein